MERDKIVKIVESLKKHFGRTEGGSNYYIDDYVLDELGEWLTKELLEPPKESQ